MLFKRLIAFLLLLAFMAGTFSRLWVVADYYAYTSKYAKNCVNKDKPSLHCNGKCQMSKKLNAEEKQQEKTQENKSETGHFILFFSGIGNVINFNCYKAPSLKHLPFAIGNYSILAEHGIFHPPRA
jgi:hypothetical protein